ncbi:8-oxo-dGTP diphosphatase [Ketogulonicigenium robustum]|uniref:8-oxo-dGTP diphosphatase n=1 Tax=Ketogulonicigenium robustum TaxID=92947 RepID=A0A1W6NVZ6_9RHOB|nr:NUDIX hydrolase [Ketogulonicigenium robustum]ARO13381.1 8-oxo-dGTP diphosphatase [Ketogulonicigenium robustum]
MKVDDPHPFDGAKVAILMGGRLLMTLRDQRAGLAFSGLWDLPGGAREGAETPRACAARELREEVGLDLATGALLWARAFEGPRGVQWFLVADLPSAPVRFGDEGQGWAFVDPARFPDLPGVIPHLQQRFRLFLDLSPFNGLMPPK